MNRNYSYQLEDEENCVENKDSHEANKEDKYIRNVSNGSKIYDELVRTSVSIGCDSDFKGCSLSEDAFAHV